MRLLRVAAFPCRRGHVYTNICHIARRHVRSAGCTLPVIQITRHICCNISMYGQRRLLAPPRTVPLHRRKAVPLLVPLEEERTILLLPRGGHRHQPLIRMEDKSMEVLPPPPPAQRSVLQPRRNDKTGNSRACADTVSFLRTHMYQAIVTIMTAGLYASNAAIWALS